MYPHCQGRVSRPMVPKAGGHAKQVCGFKLSGRDRISITKSPNVELTSRQSTAVRYTASGAGAQASNRSGHNIHSSARQGTLRGRSTLCAAPMPSRSIKTGFQGRSRGAAHRMCTEGTTSQRSSEAVAPRQRSRAGAGASRVQLDEHALAREDMHRLLHLGELALQLRLLAQLARHRGHEPEL